MRLVTKQEAADRTGYSIRSVMRKGLDPEDDFPAPVRVTRQKVCFLVEELDAWIRRQADKRGTAVEGHAGTAA